MLCRLLGLEPEAQGLVFDYYQSTLEALLGKARKEGALDEGIVDVKAHAISLDGPPRTLHKVGGGWRAGQWVGEECSGWCAG